MSSWIRHGLEVWAVFGGGSNNSRLYVDAVLRYARRMRRDRRAFYEWLQRDPPRR